MKSIHALLLTLATVFSANAFAQARIVADVIYSGGMPMPNGPQSWGTTVYSDGKVVFYQNYANRPSVVKVLTYLTAPQINKLVAAGALLTDATMERDTTAPQCMDAPYIRYLLNNRAGKAIIVGDSMNCVEGHRSDWAGYTEASFLKSLDAVVSYGAY